jgi:hypothetical protein
MGRSRPAAGAVVVDGDRGGVDDGDRSGVGDEVPWMGHF